MTDAVRAYCALYELEEGEIRYVQPKALALWQQHAACDICLRYIVYGHIGENNIEGSMFCASGRCPDCGEDCELSEQTQERVAAWRAWAQGEKARRDAEREEALPIRKQHWAQTSAARKYHYGYGGGKT